MDSRCESRSTLEQFDRLLSTFSPPDGAVSPVPLELLMCHWFGMGAGFSFVFLLVTNPLTRSSPTSGLALAVGREGRVSFLMCRPPLQDRIVPLGASLLRTGETWVLERLRLRRSAPFSWNTECSQASWRRTGRTFSPSQVSSATIVPSKAPKTT